MEDWGTGGLRSLGEPPGTWKTWTVGVGGIVGGAWIPMLGDARGHHNAFDMSPAHVVRLMVFNSITLP